MVHPQDHMSYAGARGPAAPPKLPAPTAAKSAASPAAPPVAPRRGVSPPRVPPEAQKPAGKATMIGVSAPQAPRIAARPVDGFWDAAPVVLEGASPPAVAAPVPPVTSPPLPAPSPAAPAVVTPLVPTVAHAQGPAVLSATDLRLIMHEMIDQALAPLVQRVSELERRPRAPSSPGFAPTSAATTAPSPHVHAAPAAAPARAPSAPHLAVAYPSARAAPVAYAAPPPPRFITVAPAPLLDVAAIERDVPLDLDIRGFDGGRRRRRMVVLFVLGLLLVFGGLFAMLAASYSRTPG